MIAPANHLTYKRAAEIIFAGGLIAFRTDTFYGLGADPLNAASVGAIRKLKGREESKPILLLISDEHETDRFIQARSETFDRVAKKYWPGPLTLIGMARPELPVELTAGEGTIGVRLPDDQNVRELVRICGGALTATSANLSGGLPSRSAEEVQTYFPEGLDLIIDAGEVSVEAPSTVLDLSGTKPRIVREGIVKSTDLEKLLV